MMKIDVSFRCDDDMNLVFENYQQIISHSVERYNGDYVVVPKTDSQVLKTRQKLMTDDLTVKEIPYYEVSNESNGNTVYIGKEIETYGNQ